MSNVRPRKQLALLHEAVEHMNKLLLVVALIGIVAPAQGQSTSSKRGAAAVGSGLSEWADRQAALNTEIELAKAKAEIEVEKQKRLMDLQREQAQRSGNAPRPQAVADEDRESTKLARKHPQWALILTSSAFKSWLTTRGVAYEKLCVSATMADVAGSCIDDFFRARIVVAQ